MQEYHTEKSKKQLFSHQESESDDEDEEVASNGNGGDVQGHILSSF